MMKHLLLRKQGGELNNRKTPLIIEQKARNLERVFGMKLNDMLHNCVIARKYIEKCLIFDIF